MNDYKFEHEDYYIKKHAEVVLANAMNSAWISAYSAAIIARQEDRALAIAETAVSAFRERCGEGEGEARKDNAGAVVEIDQLVLFLHDDFAAEYDGTESPVECSIRLLSKVAIQRDAAFAILRGLSKIQVGYRASLDNALIVGECIEQARALLAGQPVVDTDSKRDLANMTATKNYWEKQAGELKCKLAELERAGAKEFGALSEFAVYLNQAGERLSALLLAMTPDEYAAVRAAVGDQHTTNQETCK